MEALPHAISREADSAIEHEQGPDPSRVNNPDKYHVLPGYKAASPQVSSGQGLILSHMRHV